MLGCTLHVLTYLLGCCKVVMIYAVMIYASLFANLNGNKVSDHLPSLLIDKSYECSVQIVRSYSITPHQPKQGGLYLSG
jgi:hypothetical protein